MTETFELIPIGHVASTLTELAAAPRQGDEQGVFSTRSADRPNPIGLHRVKILELEHGRVRVQGLEAIDGTPIVDVKPVLGSEPDAR